MKLIKQYEIPVIEDNPYGELRFENDIIPSLKSMDTMGNVIFTSTFSKTFCPGLRIGWIAADTEFIEKYVLVKQGADLCTSIRSQMEIATYMDVFDFEAHIEKLVTVYRKRRDVMVEALNKTMPQGVSFTHPQGGLFLWVELPKHFKAMDLLHDCLKNNVAFVPGDSFFPNGGVENTFRLNYSNMSEEKIIEGIQRLSLAIKNVMI
ncbi:MAG: putative transcriptional regulator, GntR family [Firmicutes bacterium]|nr:putative transcriptional regulator, GntR family [Bacillota bacterium]